MNIEEFFLAKFNDIAIWAMASAIIVSASMVLMNLREAELREARVNLEELERRLSASQKECDDLRDAHRKSAEFLREELARKIAEASAWRDSSQTLSKAIPKEGWRAKAFQWIQQ